jgi:phage gp36-like protein
MFQLLLPLLKSLSAEELLSFAAAPIEAYLNARFAVPSADVPALVANSTTGLTPEQFEEAVALYLKRSETQVIDKL